MTSRGVTDDLDTTVPVLVLGGMENAICAARSLGRAGVTVRVSGGRPCTAMASRFCHEAFPVPKTSTYDAYWTELLLGPETRLDGHIILPMMDDAIAFVTKNRAALEKRYILEDFDTELRDALLDKQQTIDLAKAAGVGAPSYWTVSKNTKLEDLRAEISFPVIVKPIHTYKFTKILGRKLFIIETDFEELVDKVSLAHAHDLDVMIVEMVPGPDNLLSSYYTYVDSAGQSLFHYTKRIIRRFPTHRGGACFHESIWLPETAELAQKFFASMPWRGMANIEFKRDPRDGQLKIIEVNSRFTAAHRLVLAAGMPIDLLIYRHLTGQPVPKIAQGSKVLRLLHPFRDFRAYRSLPALGFLSWARSWCARPFITPVFSMRDPIPSIFEFRNFCEKVLRKLG